MKRTVTAATFNKDKADRKTNSDKTRTEDETETTM